MFPKFTLLSLLFLQFTSSLSVDFFLYGNFQHFRSLNIYFNNQNKEIFHERSQVSYESAELDNQSGEQSHTTSDTDSPQITTETSLSDESDPEYGDQEDNSNSTVGALSLEEENLLITGIDLNYSFNETREEDDSPTKLISSPGCPASSELPRESHPWHRSIWLHYGNPPKCFLSGIRGSCPEGMSVGPSPNSTYGICKCDCFTNLPQNNWIRQVLDPFLDQRQPFCFDNDRSSHFGIDKDNKCYKFYTKGPCKMNELFVYDPFKKLGTCQMKNLVKIQFTLRSSQMTEELYYVNGTYYEYGSECNSTVSEDESVYEGKPTRYIISEIEKNPNLDCVPWDERVAFRPHPSSSVLSITKRYCMGIKQRYSTLLNRCIPSVGSLSSSVG